MVVRVVSIGGQAPSVTTSKSGRKIYTSQSTEAVVTDTGKILSLSKTKSGPRSGSGVFVEDAALQQTRELSVFEAATVRATTGGASTPSGDATFSSVVVPKTTVQKVTEARTTVQRPVSTVSPVAPEARTRIGKAYRVKVQPVVQEAKAAFSAGLLMRPEAERYRAHSTPVEGLAYASGLVGSFAGGVWGVPKVVKGVAASQVVVGKAIQATKVGKVVQATKAGTFAVTAGRAVVEGTALGLVAKAGVEATAGSDVKSLMSSSQFKEASRVAISRRAKELSGFRRVADQTFIGVGGQTGKYRTYLGEELASRGVTASPRTVRQAAKVQLSALRAGEVSSAVYQSSLVEGFGRAGISAGFKKVSSVVTKEGLGGVARRAAGYTLKAGGFIEGGSQSVSSDVLRGQSVDFKTAATAGAVGSVSARLLGVPIIKQSIKPSGKGAVINVVSDVFDPLERPSDLVRDIGEGSVKGFKSPSTLVTRIVSPSATTFSFGGQTPSTGVSPVVAKEFSSFKSAPFVSQTPTFTTTKLSKAFAVPTAVSVPVPTVTSTPSKVSTPSETPVSVFTPSQTPTTSKTSVPIQTPVTLKTTLSTRVTSPVSTRVTVATPTIYPRLPLLPPFPPIRGSGFGGYGTGFKGFKSKKAYLPSLTAISLGITAKVAPSNKSGLNVRPVLPSSYKSKSLFGGGI